MPWYSDLRLRVKQLNAWSEDLKRPNFVWFSGLFNPTSFNTAIMQATARAHKLPLDNMTIETYVTVMTEPNAAENHPQDGAYAYGFFYGRGEMV